ncbi:ABC transporter ATP-binding protein [Lyngbya confervoides]|uniref:ABC-F family ATP-binding cassette domain-containing protein n=1 Tax=Lyngbya confervoides BDU141951 TaxID=1574623 RepID=A0ABD4T5J8_9CYAN|nr:ABC-F family ATP-binding cassette domain-containing protein [Lyngbya confervoides]MCM1984066.1 ABC-F family ATP-binding cassette domain-containing protein [Lyngbya confervoides BDU141951]
MTVLTARSLRKDFGIKEVLREANFTLEDSQKAGIIGVNGSGKSTFLKMLAGLEPIDGGDLWLNPKASLVYVSQDPQMDPEKTVLEQVFADCGEAATLVREYEELSAQIAQSPEADRLMSRLSQLSEQMDAQGAWELETQAKIILNQLGITDFQAPVGTLSGGYRKRIALAAALVSQPEVLLLDEPTNHLDALSVDWLQGFLQQFRGALLLITHDRYFLDQVTNRIVEIDRGDLYEYDGNYAYYLSKKAESEAAALSSQQKHAGVLRRELEWLRRGPKARSTKQKARIQRIEQMQDQDFKQAHGKVDISTAQRRIGKKVAVLNAVGKRFGHRTIIENFSYEFTPSDRIGIIGPNGAGKSTLLNLITGRLDPDQGTVDIGTTIHFGYFDQHCDDLLQNPNQRVIDYLKEVAELVKTADGSVITASQMLERFLFTPNQQYSPLHKLSGGERRRLFLLRVLMEAPNVLILDEPTNDLDVQTLGVLEEYLAEFSGCVIVVSHDRYFLDRTVDTIFAFESGGTLRQYPGNYSLYLDFKRAEAEKQILETQAQQAPVPLSPTASPTVPKGNSSRPRKLSYKEKREFEQLETQIPELEAEKAQLEQRLYQNPPAEFTELQGLSERLACLDQEIETATERWMELAELAG